MRSSAQAVPCQPGSPRSILASLAFNRCASAENPPAYSIRGPSHGERESESHSNDFRLAPYSQNELLISNLPPSIWITPTFTGVDNDVAKILIIHLAARKND